MTNARVYIRAVVPQLVLLTVVLVLKCLSWFSLGPSPERLAELFVSLLLTHGIPLVALASFTENFAGLGTYFPGSVALLAGMASTAGDPRRAVLTYLAVLFPAILANVLSYFLGRFLRREEAAPEGKSSRSLAVWFVGTYWHPQLAGVTAMAAGAEQVPFGRYVGTFLPISFTWSVLWALVLYNVGSVIAAPSVLSVIFYVYLVGWLLWGLLRTYKSLAWKEAGSGELEPGA